MSSRVLELWERLATEDAPGSDAPPAQVTAAARLEWVETPRGLVAWNWSTLHLADVAFREGAAFYAAVSPRGAVLQAPRGAAPLPPKPAGFEQPYPNLWITKDPGTLAHAQAIRNFLESDP